MTDFQEVAMPYRPLVVFDFDHTLYDGDSGSHLVMWLFFAFFLGFAVKIPMFPVHTWLPDAHVEAPTGGSVVLAAIMLKIGGYGFLRFSLPIVPDASHEFAMLMIALSLIAIVYVGMVALVQDDMKKLIAYSSVAHMGFVTLGIFIALALVRDLDNIDAARLGLQGAMVQMVSHGFISGALFSCVGVLYRSEEHTSELQSLMRISYAVFCLKKKQKHQLI